MALTEKQRAEKVKTIMFALKCTEEEALEVIEADEKIDKGERTEFDLPKEQEKLALKMSAITDRKSKSADSQRGKVRAENPTKSGIIAEIAEFLTEKSNFTCENVNITNKERQIAFSIGENNYEITLVQKRKKKGE